MKTKFDFSHWKINRRDGVMVIVMLVTCVIMCFIELGNWNTQGNIGAKEKAVVIEVNNDDVMTIGLLTKGEQALRIRILTGKYKGREFRAANQIRANMELDKEFKVGDYALVAVPNDATDDMTLNAQDHYRIGYTILLFSLFALLLLIFGGITGFNALLSFVFSCLVIWKLVIPLMLLGHNVLLVTFCAVALLSAVIDFLVAGLTKKGLTSFAGTMLGVLASCIMAYIFTHLFKINGGMMPYAQPLIYSGFEQLNLADIYIGSIFLASSGAVMDLSMDVASAMEEILRKKPDISRTALVQSGLTIGRSVVGTMTTTLLLAYSGGYLTLMMAFCAQGVEPIDFINNPYVASEVVKTLIGSFGLVLVAPFTAFAGGIIMHKSSRKTECQNKQ